MLHQANGAVRVERKARGAKAVDVVLLKPGFFDQAGQSLAAEPMGAFNGIARIGDRYRNTEGDVLITVSARWQVSTLWDRSSDSPAVFFTTHESTIDCYIVINPPKTSVVPYWKQEC